MNELTVKTCKKCLQTKPVEKFYIRKDNGNLSGACRQCLNEKQNEWRRNNPEARRATERKTAAKNRIRRNEQARQRSKDHPEKKLNCRLKREYGINLSILESIKEYQSYKCAICNKDLLGKNLHIDHDHETGKIRGLLCSQCNVGIGMLNDNPILLRDAARYLEESCDILLLVDINQERTT